MKKSICESSLKIRMLFLISESPKNPGWPKIRDSVNQNLVSYSLRLSVMQNFEQNPCLQLQNWPRRTGRNYFVFFFQCEHNTHVIATL